MGWEAHEEYRSRWGGEVKKYRERDACIPFLPKLRSSDHSMKYKE
jgi:hypothetical protein